MSKKVWNLMYRAGTTGRVIIAAGNPHSRHEALAGAETVTKNGWCVWVEHSTTGKMLYQNPAEVAYQLEVSKKLLKKTSDSDDSAAQNIATVTKKIAKAQARFSGVKKPLGIKKQRPMVSKFTAIGLRKVLLAVDADKLGSDADAVRGINYIHQLVGYLESQEYKSKSDKQSAISKKWRMKKMMQNPVAHDVKE